MKQEYNGKHLNIYKYALAVFLISILWAFIGGIIIALNKSEFLKIGSLIGFGGFIISYFLFDHILRKQNWIWFYR